MTTHIGNTGKVQIGAAFLAEVTDFSVDEKAQAIEDSQLTDATDTFLAGSKNWSGSITCHYDPSDSTGQELLTAGASVSLLLYPIGSAQASAYLSGTALITQIGIAVKRNAMIERTFSFQGSDTLTHSTVA